MHKLQAHKISPTLLSWIADFLTDRTFHVQVRGAASRLGKVPSGVPQGSVLGPLLFLVYVNDLSRDLECPCYLFADDIKVLGNPAHDALQRDLDRICNWSLDWDLPLNPAKCHHLILGLDGPTRNLQAPTGVFPIGKVSSARDLGIVVTDDFKPSAQCDRAVARAKSALHRLRHVVASRDPAVFLPLYVAHVRTHLEYCVQVWCPYLKKDIEHVEQVQRFATRILNGMAGLSYEQRLERLGLSSLERRRLHSDLCEAYRTVRTPDGNPDLFMRRTYTTLRGHEWSLYRERCRLKLRACFFTQRVIIAWNRLPQHVVAAATMATFQERLDRAWESLFPDTP